MDSLRNIILSRNIDRPSELQSITEFLDKNLGSAFTVSDFPKHITIAVENGKIAYVLRTKLPALEAYAAPTKKIHIRIDPLVTSRPRSS